MLKLKHKKSGFPVNNSCFIEECVFFFLLLDSQNELLLIRFNIY